MAVFDVNTLSVQDKMKTLSKMLDADSKCTFGGFKAEDVTYASAEGYYCTLQLLGSLVVDFAKMKKSFK